jgi:hypothetical protein
MVCPGKEGACCDSVLLLRLRILRGQARPGKVSCLFFVLCSKKIDESGAYDVGSVGFPKLIHSFRG